MLKEIIRSDRGFEFLEDLSIQYLNENLGPHDLYVFFSHALDPWYLDGRVRKEVGHIIYRISDDIPQPKRKSLRIFCCRPEANLSDAVVSDAYWDTLEDWRQGWIKHLVIPDLKALLPKKSPVWEIVRITGEGY